MAHAEGWIEAYSILENNKKMPNDLKQKIMNNKSGLGETMLHWYCIEGSPAIIQKIIDLGFDVNTQNKFKETPILDCIKIDRWEIVKLLLDNNASLDIKNRYGENVWEQLEDEYQEERIEKLKKIKNNT